MEGFNQSDLETAVMEDFEAIQEFLRQQGIENPTNSLINALCRNVESKKCNSCYFVADNLKMLKDHLKEKKHNYGQGRYANDKRNFIKRIKVRLPDSNLPDIDTDSFDLLSTEERIVFSSFQSDGRLSPAERSSFHNLLYIGYCCVHLKGKIDVPSPATERRARNALRAAHANETASVAPADNTDDADIDEVTDSLSGFRFASESD